MFKHILIATDGSELADKAIASGLALAKHLKASATVATVTEPWDALSMAGLAERNMRNPVADYEERATASANRVLSSVSAAAQKMGIACTTVHVKDKYPAEGVVEAAREKGCDLIVVASHGRRGISRMLLGSQATKIVALSDVAVLVCR